MNNHTKATVMRFSEIKEGDIYTFEKKITKEDVINFANFSGDFNPLHVDQEFGEKSIFKQNIVHGMLAASLFSTLVGMYCPGEKCLYLSQTLNFKIPLFYQDIVIIKGQVLSKNEAIKIITLKTEVIKENKIAIFGEAKVKVLE